MQKLFTLLVFSIFVFTANAQFQKGNKVLGAGLNFQTGETDYKPSNNKTVNNSFSLALEMGFAKKANKLNGFFINTGYGKSKYENPSQPSSNSSSDNFSASGGYFSKIYKPLGKGFFVYGEARAGINYYKSNSGSTSNPEMQQYGISIGVHPGLAYKWSDKFMLDLRFADFAELGYLWRETKSTGGYKTTDRNFSFNSSLGLGYLSNIGIGARWIIK